MSTWVDDKAARAAAALDGGTGSAGASGAV
jgi:hypothetical protein